MARRDERGVRKADKRWGVLDFVLVWAALAVSLVALWMDARFGGGTLERISTGSMDVHADFDTFWRSADAFLKGGDAYDTGARLVNLNPPFWTVLIAPFGLLEPLDAYRWFVLLTLLLTVASLAWTAEELRMRPGLSVLAVGALLISSPLLATFALGQIYPVLTLGLVAAWIADRRGRRLLSGGSLGLVVAVKPSLAPVLLWPVVRRRWGMLGAALASGAVASLVGLLALGPGATFEYLGILRGGSISAYWDNASLPAAAARLFGENRFARPIAILPWTVPVAYALGVGAIALSAAKVRRSPEDGPWVLVAASLLASPIAWHNYLVLLAPGILLLMARDRVAPALLLLALQLIPPQWPLLWSDRGTVVASLAITLYLYILVAHWLAFLSIGEGPDPAPGAAGAKEPG